MIVSHLHSPGLPDGLDVVSELPEEQVVSFLVRVELLDPCDSIDQGLVQCGCGLLQQDLQALDHVHQDLLPDTCTWQIVIFTWMLTVRAL